MVYKIIAAIIIGYLLGSISFCLPLALVFFLAIHTLIGLKGEPARVSQKKNLIMDRNYYFWQTKETG